MSMGDRNKKRILEETEEHDRKEETPTRYLLANQTAPVVPKTGGAFDFNPQCPTAGVSQAKINAM